MRSFIEKSAKFKLPKSQRFKIPLRYNLNEIKTNNLEKSQSLLYESNSVPTSTFGLDRKSKSCKNFKYAQKSKTFDSLARIYMGQFRYLQKSKSYKVINFQ